MTGDVLIVSRPEDDVARRLAAALSARGRSFTQVDGPTAARLFTIQSTASGEEVAPDVPMFVRPAPWWSGGAEITPDARFLGSECFATFWAAATLSRSPVINRPTLDGSVYRLTAGTLAAYSVGRGEIHASGPEQIEEKDGAFWAETADFRVGVLAALPADAPVRARRVDVGAGYEIVTVVGGEAFPATTDPRSVAHDLGTRSIALARQFHVHFASVTWSVTDDTAEAVRLNANPDKSDLRYRWADVLDALCRNLLA